LIAKGESIVPFIGTGATGAEQRAVKRTVLFDAATVYFSALAFQGTRPC